MFMFDLFVKGFSLTIKYIHSFKNATLCDTKLRLTKYAAILHYVTRVRNLSSDQILTG